MTTINITLSGFAPVLYELLRLVGFFMIGFCGSLIADAVLSRKADRKKDKSDE